MKWRSRVLVTAEQYLVDNVDELRDFVPGLVVDEPGPDDDGLALPAVVTLPDGTPVNRGDWIIRDASGAFSTMHPLPFMDTYEGVAG